MTIMMTWKTKNWNVNNAETNVKNHYSTDNDENIDYIFNKRNKDDKPDENNVHCNKEC